MIEDYVSPIDLELSRIAHLKHIDWNGFSMCDQCGRRTIGIADLSKGGFTCFKCYMKKEAEILENDPEWIRKEREWIRKYRVYKLREAIQKYNERCK